MSSSFPLASRFADWVLPQILSAGCFGPSREILKYGPDLDRKGEDQFSSTVQFLRIEVSENDSVKAVHVVVKFQPENAVLRESLGGKNLFSNEVLMYGELLPLIDKDGIVDELFPKYYLGLADRNKHADCDYVLLEDLSKKGYKLTEEKVFLDYDHCIMVLKEIGKFHALSYEAKKRKGPEFKLAVSKITEKWTLPRILHWRYLLHFCSERGMSPLINKQHHADLLTGFLKNFEDPIKFYTSLVEPLEPEAVLCHGDFCRNNMLFAYDNDGKPASVKFFDLQTPRYSSPVIDLSFFLLMNTSAEVREKHWDEFLDVYKQSVQSTVPDIEVPDLDFARVGIYGYLHCCFFLPMMTTDNATQPPLDKLLAFTPYELGTAFAKIGGEKQTELLVDIVQFLLRKGYIREKYY